MKHNSSDSQLIKRYRQGDVTVLPVLVKRYHQLFCKKAYWITKDIDVAADVAQDSWMTIIHNLQHLRDGEKFKGWALRVVYSKAIDVVKKHKKDRDNVSSIPHPSPTEGSSEDGKEHLLEALLLAIVQLPKDKQDVIRLFYKEEYSVVEISKFLDIPVGTVKSRLFKAREKLKSIMQNSIS